MSEVHSSYLVSVRWEGERRGLATSADGLPPLPVAAPPPFGGPPGIWSPEHLFVLAAATCWMTTFLAVAQNSKFEFSAIDCPASGTLERGDDRRFWISRIVLRPRLTILREEDRERAARLIEKAEAACLISNSMKTAVALEASIEVGAEVAV